MVTLQVSTQASTGLSAYINPSNGEAFMAVSMIAKLLRLDTKQTSRIAQSKGIPNYASKYTEVLTEGGLQGVTFLVKASDLKVFIREANKLPSSDKDHLELVLDALIDAGATAYIYNLCGYSMQKVEHKKKSLYPNRREDYMILYNQLNDLFKRCGANRKDHMKLNQLLNYTCDKKEGRTKVIITEPEYFAFCMVMSAALDVAEVVANSKKHIKVVLQFIEAKLTPMRDKVILIKESMTALAAQTKPRDIIAPTAIKKAIKVCKPKKDSKVLMAAVGELKMDLMPGMEGYIKPEFRGNKKPPIEAKMVDCMPEFDFD